MLLKKKYILPLLYVLLCAACVSADKKVANVATILPSEQNKLMSVEAYDFKKYTSIVLKTEKPQFPSVFLLEEPKRIVVDLQFTTNSLKKKHIDLPPSNIKSIQVNEFLEEKSSLSRVIIELKNKVQYKVISQDKQIELQMFQADEKTDSDVQQDLASIRTTLDQSDILQESKNNPSMDISKIAVLENIKQKETSPSNLSFSKPLNYNDDFKPGSIASIVDNCSQDICRVVVNLNSEQNLKYQFFTLKNPNRMVFDFYSTIYQSSKAERGFNANNVVHKIRFGDNEERFRMVLDSKFNADTLSVFHQQDSNRIVIIVERKSMSQVPTERDARVLSDNMPGKDIKYFKQDSFALQSEIPERKNNADLEKDKVLFVEQVSTSSPSNSNATQQRTAPYQYLQESFMSDSQKGAEPLSRMGQILSGSISGQKFTGKKISLDFKEADIKSVFKLLADISEFNIIISDDVTGSVTVHLNDVPWDQAFAIILQSRGLWYEQYGNIIRVATAEKLQKEKEAAANAEKAANAIKPLDVLFKPVSFAQAKSLKSQIKNLLSERGTVDIDDRTNTLIIKDIRENLDKAKQMVDILDTQTPQVTIEARIVEATSTFTRSFGINWGGGATIVSGNPNGIRFPNSIDVPNFALNFPIENGAINTQADIRFGSLRNLVDLDLAISMGEQEGNFKLISSPKITVLDNSSANISAGTKIPYQSQSDNNGTNVNFETATTNLTVTPHITNDGSILMNISATRDQPNFANSVNGNPSIDQRTANTEVLVKSGHTTVIGGIYSTETGGSQNRLPFLHKIPLIGFLFKNYNKQIRRSELLIFVTPKIVQDERKALKSVRQ